MKLAANLEPDDEEEDHHQAVVDDPLEAPLDRKVAEPEPDRGVPEVPVRLGPRRVRPAEREGGGHEQQNAARRLDAKEAREGPRREAGCAHERGPGFGWKR